MKKIINSKNAADTIAIGIKIGNLLENNSCITLSGDLGAGKTCFTKGIAKALNIERRVTSPTFTIMKIYHGDKDLYHFDAYRLEGLHQDLGFEEYFDGDGIAVIEWYEYMADFNLDEFLEIQIKINEDDSRDLIIIPHGKKYEKIVEELK